MRTDAGRFVGHARSGSVDPHFLRTHSQLGEPAGETLRVRLVGRGQHGRPRGDALLSQAVMHIGRGQQSKARVPMVGVVPEEEDLAVSSSVLDRAEPLGECRAILERLEVRL
jgi:hypothetical protein